MSLLPLVLLRGRVLANAYTGDAYKLGRPLGMGGFGMAFRARQIRGRPRRSEAVCLKVAIEPHAWQREAYFGDLLDGVEGALAIHDSFAAFPGKGTVPLYCLVSELAERGDLTHYLTDARPWSESKVSREIRKLLSTLSQLHGASAVHRDLTPNNIFVTADETLKLGDFGIARHRRGRQEVEADACAAWFAPKPVVDQAQRSWRAADDVYQVGLLMAALLRGSAEEKLTPDDIRALRCSPWLKAVIQRAIGDRRKRYPDAAAMLEVLKQGGEASRPSVRVTSLKGKTVVFTGSLSIGRRDAARMAEKAGATVRPKIGTDTGVVVRGAVAPDWKAEAKGQKLLDVDREAERGHAIAVIDEKRFLALAGRSVRARAPRARIPIARP